MEEYWKMIYNYNIYHFFIIKMANNYSDLAPHVANILEEYEKDFDLWLIRRVRNKVWDKLWCDNNPPENNDKIPETYIEWLSDISELELSNDTQIHLSQADWETNSRDLSSIDTLWKLVSEMSNLEVMQWWHFFSWLYIEFPWYTSGRILLRWPKDFKVAWEKSQVNLWQYIMNRHKNN